MTRARTFAGLIAGLVLPAVATAQGANARPDPGSPTADRLPIYELDPTWPPTLPQLDHGRHPRALCRRPRPPLGDPYALEPHTAGNRGSGQAAHCRLLCSCPPVLEMDPEGKVLRAWGGPGNGYTWFDQEHGIYIDHNGFVRMGTSNGMHVMKFTQDGKHVLKIGEPGVNKGSNDPDHLGGPANFYVEPKTNELFIADGNQQTYRGVRRRDREVQTALGRVRQASGPRGEVHYSIDPANPPQRYSTLHGLVGSKDGFIYVSDGAATGSRCSVKAAST